MTDIHRSIEAEIPRLRRYARALARDVAAADDLVQDCLTRALGKLHLWQEGTDLRAWLFTILHNQYVNQVRRAVREGAAVGLSETEPMLTRAPHQGKRLELRDLRTRDGQIARGAALGDPARGARRDALRGSGRGARRSGRDDSLAPVPRSRIAAPADGHRARPPCRDDHGRSGAAETGQQAVPRSRADRGAGEEARCTQQPRPLRGAARSAARLAPT